jgi:hypothetical protein
MESLNDKFSSIDQISPKMIPKWGNAKRSEMFQTGRINDIFLTLLGGTETDTGALTYRWI